MRAVVLVACCLLAGVEVDAKKKTPKKKGGHDRAADIRWLEEKSAEEGVTKLDSGLMYKVLKSGNPWAKSPLASTKCTCKYKGTLTPANGGKQFDAGEIDFAPNQGQPLALQHAASLLPMMRSRNMVIPRA